jgi:glycosyltransferase involved in cell wall biosynthesis
METERIKIFVDAHVFDKEFQGAQTFLRELYTQLMARHPELDIYFGARNTDNIKAIFPSLAVSNILRYSKRSSGIFRYLFDIPALIRKHKFQFAHFQYIVPRAISGCRYIVTLHDVLFNDFREDFGFIFRISRNYLFGRSLRQADIKTTVSAYSKQQICWHYGVPPTEVHVIHNGAMDESSGLENTKNDAKEFVRRKFGFSDFILCISRLEPRKNHALLLSKYLELDLYKRNISLVFVGKESAHVPALDKLIRRLDDNQRKHFHWLPQASQSDLKALYQACRLFVYPSKAEGFGIPPLEAATCYAPVLCSSATAMRDFSFFAPYTFDPSNETEFEQKLSQMLDTPPSDQFTGEVAKYVYKYYSWQNSSDLFYDLLQANN